MASAPTVNSCGICFGSLQGHPVFTAACFHSFHFPCIFPPLAAATVCPVCHVSLSAAPHPPNPLMFPDHRSPEPVHFSDDDPLPTGSVPITRSDHLEITGVPERAAVAALESLPLFTVLVGIKAPALRVAARAPIDLVTVLDVSGSMCGTKLALVKRAVHFVIDHLGPSDRFSIVSFAYHAKRILRLRRMSESGRAEAKTAVNSLVANGGTNIVEGLRKGVQVLKERRQANPVSGIIFLSDGNDTCHHQSFDFATAPGSGRQPAYLNLLPVSICPKNKASGLGQSTQTFPVHSFGFGSDHDPIAMHAISDASGGIFSFVESYEVVQDAFAGCIGGLLSVVAQEVRLAIRSASHGVVIKSIPSGRYPIEIVGDGAEGAIIAGDMYADEQKEFLINVSVPTLTNNNDEETTDAKTSLLDIVCFYTDTASNEPKRVEGELVEVRRPNTLSITDMMVNLAIDRQRNRILAAEAIAEAQQMAETGNLAGARTLLATKRSKVRASAAAQAGDGMTAWVEADMKETEMRMESGHVYQRAGRAFALSGMSSHGFQRATTKGSSSSSSVDGLQSTCFGMQFGAYATPSVTNMVMQSQQARKIDEESSLKE